MDLIVKVRNVASDGYCVAFALDTNFFPRSELQAEQIEFEVLKTQASSPTIMVLGALPGEILRVRVFKKQKKVWFAWAQEVIQGSKERIYPAWAYESLNLGAEFASGCVLNDSKSNLLVEYPGAPLLHVNYPEQLKWKTTVLHDQARRLGSYALAEQVQKINLQVEPLVASSATLSGLADLDELSNLEKNQIVDQAGYVYKTVLANRTRVRLVVTENKRLAMRRFKTHELVTVNPFALAVPVLQNLTVWSDTRLPAKAGQEVRIVATSSGQIVIDLGNRRYLDQNIQSLPSNTTLREYVIYQGKKFHYELAVEGFWQNHRLAPQILVSCVLDFAQIIPGMQVADIYCGSGIFTLPLAAQAGGVENLVAIEGDKTAVKFARRNLLALAMQGFESLAGASEGSEFRKNLRKQQTANNCSVAETVELAGKTEQECLNKTKRALENLIHKQVFAGWIEESIIIRSCAKAQVVVLDPPREGIGSKVISALTSLNSVQRCVLVSCDMAAWARDLALFLENDWQLEKIRSFDAFPGTHFVETVSLLTRIKKNKL